LPNEIDLLILTHSHIDHSGNIPNLISQGYNGQIICSEPTVELTTNLLLDSLNVQLIETRKHKGKKNKFKRVNTKSDAKALYQKVHINQTQYFNNVPEVAWNFYIGGYQPAQKWLKDRKDRKLEIEDIFHYQKIIVALTETDRLMKEIDKIAIE
jgi:predicted metal-dependent RNase